ncbi:MAG: TolC family protein [Gemmatimonadota bacterium]
MSLSHKSVRTLLMALAAPLSSGAQPVDTLRLSLGEAVTRGLRDSDELRLASALVDMTDAQVTTARATGLPQVRFTGNYTQVVENARATIVGQIFGQSYNYTTNLNVSQAVFQGGRIMAGARAAGSMRAASRQDVVETHALMSVSVQRAYLQAVLARELEAIQQRNIELAQARVGLVEQLESAGRASRYEVLRARVERANLEPGVLQARSARELADIEVRRLLNIPAAVTIVFTSALDTAALSTLANSIAGDSISKPVRAAVRSAEYELEARRRGITVARADLFPTVSTFFQTGFTALPSRSGFPTVRGASSNSLCPAGSNPNQSCQNNGWFPDRSFGVQVAWPLFDGLRAKGNIELAHANAKIAEVNLAQERERVELERARARSEFDRAAAAWAAQRESVGEAEEAFRIASLRFERGLGTQLEVSDAQLLLLTARTNAARATVDYYLAAAELARARGLPVPLPPTR